MPHAYTEDQLVEQPAIGLFAELRARPHFRQFCRKQQKQQNERKIANEDKSCGNKALRGQH